MPRVRAGADVSVTVRLDQAVRAAIATIGEDAWTPIEYTDAVFDEQTQTWISRAEVAEIPFTAFTSRKKAEQVTGRLVVRRIPDLNPGEKDGQATLFDTWRFHAFFTTTSPEEADTVAADKTHRRPRDHRTGPRRPEELRPGHLPSGKFTANAAWLVLARDGVQPRPAPLRPSTGPGLAKATTATIRRKLITVPARVASSARRVTLHLPDRLALGDRLDRACSPAVCGPPPTPTT